jgi:hypothetical protein
LRIQQPSVLLVSLVVSIPLLISCATEQPHQIAPDRKGEADHSILQAEIEDCKATNETDDDQRTSGYNEALSKCSYQAGIASLRLHEYEEAILWFLKSKEEFAETGADAAILGLSLGKQWVGTSQVAIEQEGLSIQTDLVLYVDPPKFQRFYSIQNLDLRKVELSKGQWEVSLEKGKAILRLYNRASRSAVPLLTPVVYEILDQERLRLRTARNAQQDHLYPSDLTLEN